MKKLARTIMFAGALLFTAVVFGNSAFAQYGYDGDYYAQGRGQDAHQYGYQSGYRDGFRKGQHEGRENDPGDINVRALQEATHGYRRWMGPIEYFQDGYRDGYHRGFRAGYETTNRTSRDRDYDDDYR